MVQSGHGICKIISLPQLLRSTLNPNDLARVLPHFLPLICAICLGLSFTPGINISTPESTLIYHNIWQSKQWCIIIKHKMKNLDKCKGHKAYCKNTVWLDVDSIKFRMFYTAVGWTSYHKERFDQARFIFLHGSKKQEIWKVFSCMHSVKFKMNRNGNSIHFDEKPFDWVLFPARGLNIKLSLHTRARPKSQGIFSIVLYVCKHFGRGLKYHLTFEVPSVSPIYNKGTVRWYFSPLQNVNKHWEQRLGTLVVP